MRWREDPTRGERPRPDAHVRPFRADDAELLHIIQGLCLQDLASHYTARHIAAWTASISPQSYGGALAAGEHILVAEMQGAIAGYAAWLGDELRATFVVPPAQGMGVGSLLVDNCTFDARSAGTPIRHVCATLNAIDFYRGLGFIPAEPGFHELNDVRVPYRLMTRPPQ